MAPLSRGAKRAFDVVVSGAALVFTAPLGLAIYVAVRLESPGHPIYRQRRVGRDGRPFDIYKFRTMVIGAELIGAGLAVAEGDARITRVGALLRLTSLDELPNLVNVLRGEMSIVGPRPTVQVQVDHYSERQRGRLKVKPGITGWAQIHGRASLPWSQRIELDLFYVEHQSLRLDAQILARTPGMLLGRRGIYKGESGGWDLTAAAPQHGEAGAGAGTDRSAQPATSATSEGAAPEGGRSAGAGWRT
ncbi:MAG: sugar transferase [Solirubrobacteraceae bacterium]